MYQKMDQIKDESDNIIASNIKRKLNLCFKFIIKNSTHAYLPVTYNQTEQL